MSESDKKKVLFIMQLPPPVHGVSVMSELIKNSDLINSGFDCDYINLATANGVSDLQKNGFSKYLSTIKILLKVILKLSTKRYFKIYITFFPFGFSFIKDSLVILLTRLFGYKPFLHLHTYGFKKSSQSSGLKKSIYKFVFKKTEVICLSDLLIEDIETLYKGKVYILPNGIPQINFKNTYTIKQAPVQLLYLSNLIRGKGILILIEAIQLVSNAGYNFHLHVAGAEHDITYEMLKARVEQMQLQDKVSFVGPQFGEHKTKLFKQADIFVLPSNYDTFGLVLLEAMQFGLPCISTNVGGIPDVLGENRGLIIPEINSRELAKAIVYLIEHPEERKKMSESSFLYFEKHYTVTQFEKAIKNLLEGQPLKVNERLINTKV